MGIQDRDYYRDGAGGFLQAWGRQGAWLWIIVITAVVFLAQCMSGRPDGSKLVALGAYNPVQVLNGEVWRLVTPLLLHANFFHLLFNMLILWWAGSRIEEVYGTREFVAFYILAGLFAQTLYLLVYLAGFGDPRTMAIGASGAVVAVLILFAFHFPRQQVLLFFIIPMPVWLVGVLIVIWDALGAVGARNDKTAYVVHLGGALFGALYYQWGIRFTTLFTRQPRAERQVRPQLRVVHADPDLDETPEPVGAAVEPQPRSKEVADDSLEAKVDRVLEKVSKFGQESLTPEEREILFKASELYKKRRK